MQQAVCAATLTQSHPTGLHNGGVCGTIECRYAARGTAEQRHRQARRPLVGKGVGQPEPVVRRTRR